MADVVISYSRENDATVRQLAEALAREGYEVWRDESPAPSAEAADQIAEQIGRAKAVVVVWSQAAAASEWVRAEANVARGLKKLVQAGADDAAPPIPFDPAQSASISDWLGAPDHPGWLRIREGVAALAGPPASDERTVIALSPAAAAAPPPPAPVAAPPPPAPAPPPPPAPAPPPVAIAAAAPAKKSKLVPVLAIVVLLVALAAGGGLAWQKGWINVPGLPSPQAAGADGLTSTLPPGPGEPAVSTEAPPATQTPVATAQTEADINAATTAEEDQFTQEAVIRNAQGFALVRSAPDGGGLTLGRINANESFSTYPQEGGWWRVRTASGTVGYVEAGSIRSRAQLQAETRAAEERRRPSGPRINRRNSENMRLFCANAGAGTPQCRTFQRQVRNQAR